MSSTLSGKVGYSDSASVTASGNTIAMMKVSQHGSFLQQNKRYKLMLQAATLREQVEALGKSGYATDPEYADKVMAIAKSKRLEAL
jgi:hypothetical protein